MFEQLGLKATFISFLKLGTFLFVLLFISSCGKDHKPDETSFSLSPKDVLFFVDPLIGTADHGHTYPGATVPFGSVQLSPDNGTQGWDWCSGYNYSDSVIVGFSHTHLSGTGIGDLCDISVMPGTGSIDLIKKVKSHKEKDYALPFSHTNEVAEAGYYAVNFDAGIQAELTASTHAGYHRYSFDEENQASIILDLGFEINWDETIESSLKIVDKKRIEGHRLSKGWARYQPVYFSAEFSKEIESVELYVDGIKMENPNSNFTGKRIIARFFFSNESGEAVEMKVGISHASIKGSAASLAELSGQDFNSVRMSARDAWRSELNKVKAESTDTTLLRTFYTALYHTMLAPVTFSDPLGEYNGPDSLIHRAEDYTRYDIFSFWDTFRAQNPLLTILHDEKIDDMMRSILDHYDQYGLLPVWSLLGNETNTMTGYHAVPILADAILKGYIGFDVTKAYEAMKESSMQNIRGTDLYREFGYIPYDLQGQSVTKTLEYAYDDWCISQVAKKLGFQEDYDEYLKRSLYYKNVYDSSTGFMRARMKDGSWKKPFDPTYSDHDFEVAEYTEGNAWQHSFFVPHDIDELIRLHGGNDKFVLMLDSLFEQESEVTGENASADISGLIGQYAHGNEPSHHIAYMYNYAGEAWKTQERVFNIMTTQYSDQPSGLCGNEDCGQMSAWYVLSAIGMYSVNPASGIYHIGTPMLQSCTLEIAGKEFIITAEGLSSKNRYIQEATLNGQALDRSYIEHDEMRAGGNLIFRMGPNPNKNWPKLNDSSLN